MRLNTRSLRFRLVLWYSVMVVAVMLLFAFFAYNDVHRKLYADMERILTRRAHQIAANVLSQSIEPGAVARQVHDVYSPEANSRFIRILRPDHTVLYISGRPQDGHFDPAAIAVPETDPKPARIEPISYRNDMFITSTKANVDDAVYTIEMGAPTDDIEQALGRLELTLLYGLPVLMLIVSAGGYWLVGRSLKPVEDIRLTAQQITFGNLSSRLPVVRSGDALEHLSITLNQMLDRLENAYEQASRFSADASHELRTPLTIMRGELESMVLDRELPAKLRERMGSVLEEAESLSRIAESLFTLSRFDAGEVRVSHSPCDLSPLARTIAEQMLLLAEDKQISVAIDARQPVMVEGDAARLKQLIVNLMDNAIKYTGCGGHIALRVTETGGEAQLEVSDNGIGIPQAALPHVFERFYRADKVRSREIGGAGLGLSIVRAISAAHGGSVTIESMEGKGTRVCVRLPLMHAQEQAA